MVVVCQEAERGTRGESPGALTYGERLSRRWLVGRNYAATNLRRGSSWAIDRRSASVGRGEYGVTSSYLVREAGGSAVTLKKTNKRGRAYDFVRRILYLHVCGKVKSERKCCKE